MNCSQYLDDPGVDRACCDVQVANRDRQGEPSRAGAPRVYELHAVTLADSGFMRVSGNHDLKAGRSAVNERAMSAQYVYLLHVMQHVNAHTLELHSEIKRDLLGPRPLVIVPPDGMDR